MNTLRALAIVLLATSSAAAVAQLDVSGIWQGELAVSPDARLTVHFVLTRAADGSYAAVVTSPDPDGVKDIAASSASFENNRLLLTVDALSGSYEGTWEDGIITGEWMQEGGAIPLALSPYERPVMSRAAMEALVGEWTGELETPVGVLTTVFRFELDANGELQGALDVPDQGAQGLAISDIELADGALSLRVPQVRGEYKATLDGEQLVGTWSQGPQALPLTLARN